MRSGARAPRAGGLGTLLRWAVALTAAALALALVPGPWVEVVTPAGIGLLLSAPYVLTLTAAVLYARRRSWTNAGLAALLLALLLVGLWLGTGRVG